MANLYIAGSSVFPTGGAANPTLTIVALASRLADHLKKQLAWMHPAPQYPDTARLRGRPKPSPEGPELTNR